jgi:hypothetical protein
VLHAIETAIGDGSTVVVSYYDFQLDHGIEPRKVSPALRLLDCLGLIDIEPGWRSANMFRLSNRWRTLDADEAAWRVKLARGSMRQRTSRKPVVPKAVKVAPKPVIVDPPRDDMQRRVPSLPRLAFLQDDRR